MINKIFFFLCLIIYFTVHTTQPNTTPDLENPYDIANLNYDIALTIQNLISYLENNTIQMKDFFNNVSNEDLCLACYAFSIEYDQRNNLDYIFESFDELLENFETTLSRMPKPYKKMTDYKLSMLNKKFNNEKMEVKKSFEDMEIDASIRLLNAKKFAPKTISFSVIKKELYHLIEFLKCNTQQNIKEYFFHCSPEFIEVISHILKKEFYRRVLPEERLKYNNAIKYIEYLNTCKATLDSLAIKEVSRIILKSYDLATKNNNIDKSKTLHVEKNSQASPQSESEINNNAQAHQRKVFGIDSSQEKPIDRFLASLAIQYAPDEIHMINRQLTFGDPESTFFPKQILLVGKPGTGKTTLAKAIALKSGRKYRFIEAPELLTGYKFSGCENLIASINDVLEKNEPYVIIIDEITSLTERYHHKHGFADKETSTALWLALDKCADNPNIIFIGIANDIKNLPRQLKSRF